MQNQSVFAVEIYRDQFKMVASKKVSFTKIWKFIQQMDSLVGQFLFKDPSEKFSRKDQLLVLSFPVFAFLFVFLMGSTLIITKFRLISMIFCFSLSSAYFQFYVTIVNLIRRKSTLKDLFEWCSSLYDVNKKFHNMVQK